jgi:endonuclease YncB( thermonuclease family)
MGRRSRRNEAWRAGPLVRLGRALVFVPIAAVVALRLAELVTGYTTPTTGCRVTGVVDGDTVRLSCPDSGATRGRLVGFDTPEIFSPDCASERRAGLRATWELRRALWAAERIETADIGADRYGRRLVVLLLDGEDVAGWMVASGLARPYDGGKRRSWCE